MRHSFASIGAGSPKTERDYKIRGSVAHNSSSKYVPAAGYERRLLGAPAAPFSRGPVRPKRLQFLAQCVVIMRHHELRYLRQKRSPSSSIFAHLRVILEGLSRSID